MSLVINDNDTCKICGAYKDDNKICSNGHYQIKKGEKNES